MAKSTVRKQDGGVRQKTLKETVRDALKGRGAVRRQVRKTLKAIKR